MKTHAQIGIADVAEAGFYGGEVALEPLPRHLDDLLHVLPGVVAFVAQDDDEHAEHAQHLVQRIADQGGGDGAAQHDADPRQIPEGAVIPRGQRDGDGEQEDAADHAKSVAGFM